ncbi:unnamed protein product [Gongylonema pulchrum]|uniref:Protein kinase domain-containing protein n=1 Tax=Gongylonema pulchrum TaxID=637853 RepID=A0A183DQS9_9BILA|nr:unnamed protein product [Gongylonema pulchrum]
MPRDKSSEDVLKNYEHVAKVGEGTYGVVYKTLDKRSGKYVAMKKIRTLDGEEGIPTATLADPNIVALNEFVLDDDCAYLVFEYCPIDLNAYIRSLSDAKLIDREVQKQYTYRMLQAICFCHQRGVMHRDLKPENIMMDEKGAPKLADFGIARPVGLPIKAYTQRAFTLWYAAPELLLGSTRHSAGVDIWSIGCTFAELATTEPLFPGDSQTDQLYRRSFLSGPAVPSKVTSKIT